MTQQQANSIWSVLSRLGGGYTVLSLSVIGFFVIDFHAEFKKHSEKVIALELQQLEIKKDVAYHTVYITNHGERLTKLENKQ